MHDLQVVGKQDHVRRLPRHVDCGIHRQADVGGLQRRGIVDAVSKIADDLSARFQRQDDAILLLRTHPAEKVGTLDHRLQAVVVQLRYLRPAEHALYLDAEHTADVAGHLLAVAGDDLQRDAVGGEHAQRLAGGLLRWVEKRGKPAKRQPGLVIHHGMRVIARDLLNRHAEHSKTFVAQRVQPLLQACPLGGFEGRAHVVVFEVDRQPQNFLGCTLDHQEAGRPVVGQDRDAAALEVEWHFVDFLQGAYVDVAVRENGVV